MTFVASAPGKLVLLGEYAVLDGVEALAMAVDRRVEATLVRAAGERSTLTTRAGHEETLTFRAGEATGAGLVDAVIADSSALDWPAWQARLDSTAFFAGPHKLGLGSSAAVLTAWAGVWCAAAAPGAPLPTAESLIAMHRRFQGGAGSGLDVATARQGGIVRYRLDPAQMPQIGSVRLPNSVGFAGIFAGRSASTVNLVGRYRAWQRDKPAEAAALLANMKDIAATGCATAEAGDGAGFVAALAAYGESLDRLGLAMDVDLVTREHREIGLLATQFDVAYKVSGAGGGDLGIAASVDRERLRAFVDAVSGSGFLAVPLAVATQGLIVEEQD